MIRNQLINCQIQAEQDCIKEFQEKLESFLSEVDKGQGAQIDLDAVEKGTCMKDRWDGGFCSMFILDSFQSQSMHHSAGLVQAGCQQSTRTEDQS